MVEFTDVENVFQEASEPVSKPGLATDGVLMVTSSQ
jgi:hypothetical protein